MYKGEHQSDGDTGKADRRFSVSGSEHSKHQKGGQHYFNQEGGQQVVMTGRVFAITVGGETCHRRIITTRRAFDDEQQQSRRQNGTEDLGRSEERRVGKECRSRWSPY